MKKSMITALLVSLMMLLPNSMSAQEENGFKKIQSGGVASERFGDEHP